MGDEQDGHARVRQGPQQVEDSGLDGDVQGGGGLVGDEDGRVAGHGQGDADSLELTAGELVGVGAGDALEPVALPQARAGQQLAHAGAQGGARRAARGVGAHGLADLGGDGLQRVQGRRRLLEDGAHQPPARIVQDCPGGAHELDPVRPGSVARGSPAVRPGGEHPGRTGDDGGVGEQAQGAERGDGLSRAGLAHQRQDAARHQVEVDVGAGGTGAAREGHPEAAQAQRRPGGAGGSGVGGAGAGSPGAGGGSGSGLGRLTGSGARCRGILPIRAPNGPAHEALTPTTW